MNRTFEPQPNDVIVPFGRTHRERDIDWLSVVRFHRELARWAQDTFFSLPAGADARRWTALPGLRITSLAGPWELDLTSPGVSAQFLDLLRCGEASEVFLGGPCWPGAETWKPLFYRAVRVELDGTMARIVPDEAAWDLSPQVAELLSRRNLLSAVPLDSLQGRLYEAAQARMDREGTLAGNALYTTLLELVPELRSELTVSAKGPGWVLFTPPSQATTVMAHLLHDYDLLERRLLDSPGSIGGLRLLDDPRSSDGQGEAVDVMPVVPLNASQEAAVAAILGSRPVTVISGPPGTGKSQVVVSLLLNAWARGTTVLFASTNNEAVEVVRERLEHFEDDLPLHVRAGNQRHANVTSVLHDTLNYITAKHSVSSPAVVARRRAALEDEKVGYQQLLDTGIPQRVAEGLRGALTAYGEYRSILAGLEADQLAILDGMSSLGYDPDTLSPEGLSAEVITPLTAWLQGLRECRAQLIADDELRADLTRSVRDSTDERDAALARVGCHGATAGAAWLARPDRLEGLRNWITAAAALLANRPEDHLDQVAWSPAYDRWDGTSAAQDFAGVARDLAAGIRQAVASSTSELSAWETAQADQALAVTRLASFRVTGEVALKPFDLASWTAPYAALHARPPGRLDWLPLSTPRRLHRRLRRAETHLRGAYPTSTWIQLGVLDDTGRERLAELVDATLDSLRAQENSQALQDTRVSIETTFEPLRQRMAVIDAQPPEEDSREGWLAAARSLEGAAQDADAAAGAWRRRGAREHAATQLRDLASAFDAGSAGVPLLDAWRTGHGLSLTTALGTLRRSPTRNAVDALRDLLQGPALSLAIEAWHDARSSELEREAVATRLAAIPTAEERATDWRRDRPPALTATISTSDDLALVESTLVRHLDGCSTWIDVWSTFEKTVLVTGAERAQGELAHACTALRRAVEVLPLGNVRTQVIAIAEPAFRRLITEWPTERLATLFEEFQPQRLEAKIERLDRQLAEMAFREARAAWLARVTNDPEAQTALDRLRLHYRAHNNRIEPQAYASFHDMLRAIPLWVTTAQASQAVPMEDGLFDLLIIDEAAQCTVTNLLPLIYRAKRIAVIGDREQLPAIPTLGREGEQTLATRFGVAPWLDIIGHNDNNVYEAAVRCLPQRRSDIRGLDEHYRSHPLIIGFSNRHIYRRRLRLRRASVDGAPLPAIDGRNVRGGRAQRDGGSWVNRTEAEAVCQAISELRTMPGAARLSVGVVTPFRAQMECIRRLLGDPDPRSPVKIGTAHSFQGGEQDVMIFSPVVAPGMSEAAARWVENPANLINVAVTRARDALVLVADFDACRAQPGILGALTSYVETVMLLRATSPAELELYTHMVLHGWEPSVHCTVGKIEVDFVLERDGKRLAIEVDGAHHAEQIAADAARDAFLGGQGYQVRRFSARVVLESPETVIADIEAALG